MAQELFLDVDDTIGFGVTKRQALRAAEVCGDTSVLEILFPLAFKTKEGEELLKKKKAALKKEAEKEKPPEKSPQVTSEAEFVLKMDKRTLNAVASILGCFGGAPEGPRGAMQDVSNQLKKQGAENTYFRIGDNGKTKYLPDTWDLFEAERFKIGEE